MVLLARPSDALLDPVLERIETDKAAGTLFASAAEVRTSTGRVDPKEAFWLEVKVVGQFTYTQGIPGPNRAYASELTRSLTVDLAKMGRDGALEWAGLLLVLFTADEETAEHDLTVAMHRSLDRGVLLRAPAVERFAVPDRIGNRVCTVAVIRAG